MLLFLGAKIDKIFDMTKFWDDFNTTLTFKIGENQKKERLHWLLSFLYYLYLYAIR